MFALIRELKLTTPLLILTAVGALVLVINFYHKAQLYYTIKAERKDCQDRINHIEKEANYLARYQKLEVNERRIKAINVTFDDNLMFIEQELCKDCR